MAGVIATVTGGELRGDGSVLIFFVERTAELGDRHGHLLRWSVSSKLSAAPSKDHSISVKARQHRRAG